MKGKPTRRNFLVGAAATAASSATPAHSQDSISLGQRRRQSRNNQTYHLQLALVMDVSRSITNEEFRFQKDGTAIALLSDEVKEKLLDATPALVSVIQFADYGAPAIDWIEIHDESDLNYLAAMILGMRRVSASIIGNGTNIAAGIDIAVREIESYIEENNLSVARKVIDVSGDGISSYGVNRDNDEWATQRNLFHIESPYAPNASSQSAGLLTLPPINTEHIRSKAESRNITINGLPIIRDNTDSLTSYFNNSVKSSNGFVEPARGMRDFPRAIQRKLSLEIA